MKNFKALFTIMVPVYVTRPTANKEIFNLKLAMIWPFLIMIIGVLNAVVWGCIGLYAAFCFIF